MGNVRGAVYSDGLIISVAGLSPELNYQLAEEVLATSLDEAHARINPPELVLLPERADVA